MLQTIGLILALATVGTLGCENATLPDGSYCPESGLKVVADPDHCSQYWECYNGCLTHMICQGNYLFDDVHGWCNIPESVCCGDRDCDGKHCKPDEECEPVDFDCPADGDFEDPHLCSTYYKCSGGIATRMCCQQVNGQQLMFRQSNDQCDFEDRVDCGKRPVCDCDGGNCHQPATTTTRKPNVCDSIACDHGDGFYPEGPCESCFCECVGGVHYELCCSPGLVWNQAKEQCDYPSSMGC